MDREVKWRIGVQSYNDFTIVSCLKKVITDFMNSFKSDLDEILNIIYRIFSIKAIYFTISALIMFY